jgi:monoamine oxidase
MLKSLFLSLMMVFAYSDQPRIVVVGAGLSGLTTAYRLNQMGYRVEVYEARNRVGGRVFTVDVKGHLAELGGQNINDGGECRHLMPLIEELGLELETKQGPMHYRYYEDGQEFDANQLCLQDPQLLRAKLEALREKESNMEGVLKGLFDEDDICYKAGSALLAGYEGGQVGKLSSYYVETLYHILTGGLSSAHQERVVHYAWIKGGNYLLAQALAKNLSVHLNHPLTSIEKSRDGTYLLTFKDNSKVFADIVVLTMPCATYKDIVIEEGVIPEKTKQAILTLENGTTTKIVAPIVPEKAHFGGIGTDRMTTFLNRDRHVINLYLKNGYSYFTPETLSQVYQKEFSHLQKFYDVDPSLPVVYAKDEPLASYETAVGHSWPTDPFAKGSYSYIGAGQEEMMTATTDILGETVKTLFAPIDSHLFFAGEHTSILFDVGGTMEAAVESGARTARLVEKVLHLSDYK